MNADKALEVFEMWYEQCIEGGLCPEEIVEQVGEMKLLINEDQITAYEQGQQEMDEAKP